ncbi:hypothetical protein [Clostridium perfringens]|uniref:hypothetical protein n=1 Tax=Clostridium perfringens TaxID=1502 RepID=UPI0018E40213|nr:hypothetical protein [Clostridium perfringens]MBI5997003.1 hypothetical protein [Clostridium perfringens]MDK0863262.1 hypothetical protein [Clostridium perfringens]
MTKNKNKIFIVILSVLILILACFFGVKAVYKSYFAPKVSVTSINSNIELNDWNLIKKFLPNNINLSLKEINVSSTTEFSDSELTDLFILALREEPEAIKDLTGLKVDIENDDINIYVDINYKDIPFQGKLTFTAQSKDGKGIFHYKEGKVGFIDISKDTIFKNLQDNSILSFDKNNGDIILSFKDIIKYLKIKSIKVENNKIVIVFNGTIPLLSSIFPNLN